MRLESSKSGEYSYQASWNIKKPRVNYLQACQWGVCSDISDKGTAVSVNERHKSVHDTIKDKGTAAVIPLNYLPVRGMHQDRRQRSRQWGLHSCQGEVWSLLFTIGSRLFNLLHSNQHILVMPCSILKLFTFLECWNHSSSFELCTIHVRLV